MPSFCWGYLPHSIIGEVLQGGKANCCRMSQETSLLGTARLEKEGEGSRWISWEIAIEEIPSLRFC